MCVLRDAACRRLLRMRGSGVCTKKNPHPEEAARAAVSKDAVILSSKAAG
jgi:hypothetical protein